MSDDLSRRAFVLAAAALALTGCGREQPAPPPRPTARTLPPPTPTPEPALPQPPHDPLPGGYEVVSRSSWTDAPVKRNHVLMGTVTRITVHHTGEHAGLVGLPDVEVVARIEKYHRNEKNWAAIGYHFLIGKDGKVYEGRPARYQGAHTSTQNENNLGISVIGDFMRKQPNARQLATLRALLDDKRRQYGVSRSRIYGHRDLHASQCPGDALYAWLKNYRTA